MLGQTFGKQGYSASHNGLPLGIISILPITKMCHGDSELTEKNQEIPLWTQ
jgi:hypothetical protein